MPEYDFITTFPPAGWVPDNLKPVRQICGHYSKAGVNAKPEHACVNCYNKFVDARTAELEQRLGLPRLVGTPKQVAYATRVRAIKLLAFFHRIRKGETISPKANEKLNWFRTEVSAAQIINSRMFKTGVEIADLFPELFEAPRTEPQTAEMDRTDD